MLMNNVSKYQSEWTNGKKWIDNFTREFVELETLADGLPLSNQKNSPRVGVATIAGAVRDIPRNSVQDLPILSAVVNGTKLSTDAIVCSFILRDSIFSKNTFGNGILSTILMADQIALTTGFCPLRYNMGKLFNQWVTSLETIHYNDVVIEPGVFDAANSHYYMVRTRMTEDALEDLISKVEANPDTKWNVKGLKAMLDNGPATASYNNYLPASKQNASLGSMAQYDIITKYGVGPYHDMIVFSPQQDAGDAPLLSIKSKSKFGFPRVSFLVIDPAQLSPFGLSRVKLASPMANYGNIYLQSTAKMQLLNADAPIFKRGVFTSSTPMRRGAEWTSVDPNANVEIKELSNSTLTQFYNIMNYVETNISGIMGAQSSLMSQSSAYQNTDMVQSKAEQRKLSSEQVTSITENALMQYGRAALDLFLSEQVGETYLIVDDEAKESLNRINPTVNGVPFVGDDNKILINWENLYSRLETLSVDVELSIRRDQLKDAKRKDLQDTFTVMKQTAGQDPTANAQANALGNALLEDSVPEVAKQMQNMQQQEVTQNIAPIGGEQQPPQA